MNATEFLTSAFLSMRAHLLRSLLTMLGIFIGVASIIAIVAIGKGGQNAVVSTLENNQLRQTIEIVPRELVVPGIPQPGQILSFSNEDFDIARQFQGVLQVAETLYGQAAVSAGRQSANLMLEGGPDYLNGLANFSVIQGRMFTNGDVLTHQNVALLSQQAALQLFGRENVVGQSLVLGGQTLQVIGVTASTEPSLLNGILGGGAVYLPYTTLEGIFPNWTASEMDIAVQPGVSVPELSQRIVTALNIHAHSAEAFETSAGFLQGIEKLIGTITNILTLVIGAVAGIALVVGGVGVMNIMLVSVTERTQEIGIRMSLGATKSAIVWQFLFESMMLTATGGLLGIVFGVLVTIIVRAAFHFPVAVSWQVAIGAFLFSALIGLVCGLYPALKASRLLPVDALRYE